MADICLQVVPLQMRSQVRTQLVGRSGLTDAANIIATALDGQKRGAPDPGGIDLAAPVGQSARGKLGFLEDPLDGLDIELLGQIQNGEILVVEVLDPAASLCSPLARWS